MSNLIDFKTWCEQNLEEGGAMRRAKRDAFIRQTMPPLAPANVHSGGTGHPFAVKNASKTKTDSDKKKKSKKKKKS